MPKPQGNADKSNRAEASTPAARSAASQTAGKQGADTGEGDYELPSAADVAAHLPAEPAARTDDDEDQLEATAENDTETAEEITARERAIEAKLGDDDGEDDEQEQESDESEQPAAKDDDAAEGSGDEENDEDEKPESEEEQEETEQPAKRGASHRIDQLTAGKKQAEEEAAQLREQLATANFHAPAFGAYALVDDLSQLGKAENDELSIHQWAVRNEGNPEGAELPDGKGGTKQFTADEIRAIKANTFEALFRHIPARKEYLKEKAAAEQSATTAYPWLRSVKEGDGAAVQQLIEARPYLRLAPDYRTLAADAHIGAKLRKAGVAITNKVIAQLAKGAKAQGQGGGNAAPAARPAAAPAVRRTAPSPSRPGVLPPRMNGREAAARVAEKALSRSDGSLDDLSKSIAAKLSF